MALVAAFVLLLAGGPAPASRAAPPLDEPGEGAVSAPDPLALLRQADRRLREVGWLEYDFEYVGAFSMQGRASGHALVLPGDSWGDVDFVAEVDLAVPPNGFATHPRRVTQVLEDGRILRLDPAGRRVESGTLRGGGLLLLRATQTFLLPMFTRAEPFGVEIDQPVEHVYGGRAEVAGTPCDVVRLVFPADSPLGEQWFYFGVEDHLPRRLVFVSPGAPGGDPVMFEITLSHLRSGDGEPPRPLTPATPEGWETVDHDRVAVAPGDEAAWELSTPDGGTVRSEDLAGEVLVLDFWATWCPFCRATFPAMEALAADLEGRPARHLAVQVWDDHDAAAFLAAEGVELDVLTGGDDLATALRVTGTPTAVVIAADGTLVQRIPGVGEAREAALRQAIETALERGGDGSGG